MTIGKEDESRQRDILPFLLMVMDEETVTAADVNRKFLMEPEGHVYGGRWLFAMHGYKLIEPINARRSDHPNYGHDAFQLTKLGAEMANARVILVPEYGEYTIHLTDDVLIVNEWLACLPNKDTTPYQDYEDIKKSIRKNEEAKKTIPINNKQNEEVQKTIPIKRSDIENWKNKAIPLPAQNMSCIRIIDMEDKVELSKKKINVEIKVVLTEDGKKVVRVINGDSNVIYAQEFELDFPDILGKVLNANGFLYDTKTSTALLNKMQITKDVVKEGAIKIPSLEIDLEDLGKFIVSGLDRMPALPVDWPAASLWATIDLEQKIRDYITEDEYDNLRNEVASALSERFSEDVLLEQMPDYIDRIREIKKSHANKEPAYWYMLAPHDLLPIKGN